MFMNRFREKKGFFFKTLQKLSNIETIFHPILILGSATA